MSLPSSSFDRSVLPSRPVPWISSQKNQAAAPLTDGNGKKLLDASRLIGMTRVGSAVVSPNGKSAVVEVQEYDFDVKKFNPQLWWADLALAATLSDDEIRSHLHLRRLTEGKEHDWTSVSSPQFSPCGKFLAFLSDRPTSSEESEAKTSVWILPVDGPGEARLLAEFPVSVSDLEWTAHGGLAVAASVYVDQDAVDLENARDPMTMTAKRDKALADNDALGGLDAVLYQKLPIREWDRWLNAKMPHPFYAPLSVEPGGQYTCNATNAEDLMHGIPIAVPSGAFGGSDDWSISPQGHVAVSARPPLAPDEAWTTNRHIYLKQRLLGGGGDGDGADEEGALGTCLTAANPGYDTNPTFSPDGTRLAWLTMAGPSYEMDAIGIRVHDLATGETTTLLRAEEDWEHSPYSLTWSRDGSRLYFTSDVRSRGALCSIDSVAGAGAGGEGIAIHTSEGSTTPHGEVAVARLPVGHHQYLTTYQSLTLPSELFLTTTSASDAEGSRATRRQLTHFNTARIAETALGRPTELVYRGAKDEDVQAWLIKPAGLTPEEEERGEGGGRRYPLAVIYHGGPQGSTGDDWHYRWNLQYYASMGFAVLAPNFHGSTGFGHRFCRDISGNWEVGGIDTIAGVRAALAANPWLDPGRVVGLGASYGGYTSNWLNGNAPGGMFRALVCHCGTFDLKSSYYATEELFFMETEFGGPAHSERSREEGSPYQRFTPSARAHEWETPTLVIHGARDYRLVESEGISTFTALQRRGVPSQLLYLPGENHHCLNPQNSMVWHETVLGWIRKWTAEEGDEGGDEGGGDCEGEGEEEGGRDAK